MFRRARLSVKPNVRPGGRGGGCGPAAADSEPQCGQDSGPSPAGKEPQPGATASPGAAAAPRPEPSPQPEEEQQGGRDERTCGANDVGEASTPADTPLQRRKRISTVPNLAKPRVTLPSAQRSVSKSSQKQVPQSLINGNSSLQKESYPSDKTNTESSPKSPILPEKKTPVPQVPQFSPLKKSLNKESNVGVTVLKNDEILQKNTPCPLKERSAQERPTREEVPRTKSILIKDKQKCSDRERILKAQKLREMLKEELKKERMKRWKNKPTMIDGRKPPDHSKMTMRDLIYYLPENNPMKSSLTEEKKTEKTSTQGQIPEERSAPNHEDEAEAEGEAEEREEDDGPLLVPRVKVAEDGSIILDEESLTVEVSRTKGPCVVEENEPIFERGSTTTYSSFRKSFYTKPWSNKETDMFFLAISMVGTDFSMIGQLFPHRERTEIKNKFKREEKANGWRIDKAFKEKRPFDFQFFAQLLEEVLEDEKKRKQKAAKRQSSKEKKPAKSRKKQKAKVVSGEANNDQNDSQSVRYSDTETEVGAGTAEKENEESLNVSEQTEEQTTSEPVTTKKKRKKKKKDDSEVEVVNPAEERAGPSKPAKGGKSSKKKKNAVSDTSGDNHTECSEELEVLNEENVDEASVLEEKGSSSCLQLNDKTEESDLSLSSFQDASAGVKEIQSSEPETPDTTCVSQDWQPLKYQDSDIRNKKGDDEETNKAKNNEVSDICKPDEKESTAGKSHDSTSETMKTEKGVAGVPSMRRCLRRPKPNLARGSGKTEAAAQEKSETSISPAEHTEEAEKMYTMEAGEDKTPEITRDETTGRKIEDLETEFQKTEKAAVWRGRRQKFKPNVMGASGKRETLVQGEGKDETPQESEGAIEKLNTDQGDTPGITREEATEKDGKVSETKSRSNEASCLQEGGKQSVLKPATLMRGRMQRLKPNVGRAAGRREVPTTEKDAECEKTEVGEAVKSLMHHENESEALLTTDNATSYEDSVLRSEIAEKEAIAGLKKLESVHVIQFSQDEPLESESCEQGKESSVDNLENVSDVGTGDTSSQKEKVVQPAHLLSHRSQKPQPNLDKEAGRQKVDKDVSEESTEKDNHLIHSDSVCSMLLDLDKIAKCDVQSSLQSLGKDDPSSSQELSATLISLQSPKELSGSESGEQNESSPHADNQEVTSAIAVRLANKHISQEESKSASLQPAQLVRSRFQRPKPNVGRAVGKKETRAAEKDETKKKTEAEQSALQKDGSSGIISTEHKLQGQNEAVSSEASGNKLTCGKDTPEGESSVPDSCQNVSDEQSSSQEDKPCAIKPAQLKRSRFQRTRPNLGRAHVKKEEPMAEKVTAPVEVEMGKAEESPSPHRNSDGLLSREAKVEPLTRLGDLAQKDGSGSSGVTSPKRSIQSERLCSPVKSLSCSNLRDQRKSCMSVDDEGRPVNYSERSSSGEESKPSAIKPAQLVRGHLRRPKPNLIRATRKKEILEEGENITKEKTEAKNTEESLIPCGTKSENLTSSVRTSGKLMEVASSSEDSRKRESADSIEAVHPKRSRQSCKFQSPEKSSESESQIEREEDSPPIYAQQMTSDKLIRKQSRTSSEHTGLPKRVPDLRVTAASASECKVDHCEKGKSRRKVKPDITKGKSLKTAHSKRTGKEHGSSKVTLVTLRASQEEDEDDADDFEPEDEDECFSPEEVNKAPVFVPVGLRSPKPVPVQVEETMEELEISVDVPDEPCITTSEYLSHDLKEVAQPVVQRNENLIASQIEVTTHENPETDTGINDGSTEAAMTLLAMGDPMFQLKISTSGRTQVFPEQDELHVLDNLINQPNAEQNVVPSNQSLSSPTNNELVPSENGSKVMLQDQSSGTEAGVEKCSKEDAAVISDHSVPKVNSTSRLARCRLPKPKPNLSRVLGMNRNVHQKPVVPGADMKQFKQVQTLRDTTEEQEVEEECMVRPAENSSAHMKNAGSGSPDLAKTENEIREKWDTSLELKTLIVSPKAEISLPALEDAPNQNSIADLPENKPCTVVHNWHEVQLPQTEPVTQEFQPQCITSTKETSVSGSGNEYPEEAEEQTFILTLVEIPTNSEEYHDASLSLEHALEPLLPAPILLTPMNTGFAKVMEEQSSGSLAATGDEATTSLDNCTGIEGLQKASVEPVGPDLSQTSWKRCAVDYEESDVPPAKRTPSTSAEDQLANTSKESSVKSTHATRKIAGRLSEKPKTSKKERLPTSISQTEERGQSESSQNLGAVPLEESPCNCSDELVSGMHQERQEDTSEKGSSMDICESGHSGHVGTTAASSRGSVPRDGRRPPGFLSLICKTSNSEPGEDGKENKPRLQKSLSASKRSLKRITPSTENNTDTQESCSLPSTSELMSSECETVGMAAVQVSSESSEKQDSCTKEQEKEEEPTKISEYFFSDIFMEVDDSE